MYQLKQIGARSFRLQTWHELYGGSRRTNRALKKKQGTHHCLCAVLSKLGCFEEIQCLNKKNSGGMRWQERKKIQNPKTDRASVLRTLIKFFENCPHLPHSGRTTQRAGANLGLGTSTLTTSICSRNGIRHFSVPPCFFEGPKSSLRIAVSSLVSPFEGY